MGSSLFSLFDCFDNSHSTTAPKNALYTIWQKQFLHLVIWILAFSGKCRETSKTCTNISPKYHHRSDKSVGSTSRTMSTTDRCRPWR